MRKVTTTLVAAVAAAVIGVATPLVTQADAAMLDGAFGAGQVLAQNANVERVQFFFGGQNFCWYLNGWRGPGWYWCGYAWRSGYGWGGGYGWNGWRQPGWNGGRWGRHDGDWRHRDGSGSYTPHSAPHMSAIPHMSSGGNGKRWPK